MEDVSLINPMTKLFPYQKDHCYNLRYALKKYGRVLDNSDTGTGKTFCAIVTCLSLGLKPFVICPKSVITQWRNICDMFKDCVIGETHYGIANYESLQNCKYFKYNETTKSTFPYIIRIKKGEEQKVEKKKKHTIKENMRENAYQAALKRNNIKEEVLDVTQDVNMYDENMHTYVWKDIPKDMVIIFDEAHRCKNFRTLNSVLLYSLSAIDQSKIMLLSATISDKPENFALAGYSLKLYPNLRDAPHWISKVNHQSTDDIKYKKEEIEFVKNVMSGVNQAIFPEHASRMRIKDLGDKFPDNQVIASCLDMDCAKEIEEQYKLIEEEVARLKMSEDASGCALARILYARMRIEHLKTPSIIEEARKYLEEHNAVAIFVNFTATLKLIADELKTSCVVYGQQTGEERDLNISNFNSDSVHAIVCNIRSGGVGISLHDLHGNYPRVSIISPSWSAQDIIQALGRTHRSGGKTAVRQRIIYCKGTVEEMICENMKEKINNIAYLNDNNTISYKIEGLNDNKEEEILETPKTKAEHIKLRIEVLKVKKQRLQDEIAEANKEIEMLSQE